MQNFELEPGMLSMGGVFYPTGYLFVMFPQIEDAQHVAAGLPAEHLEKPNFLLPPDTVLEKIVGTVGSADIPLPSIGTEGATVRLYAQLASTGHCALMVYADSVDDAEAVMAVVRTRPFACARKYRMLVIEDLV